MSYTLLVKKTGYRKRFRYKITAFIWAFFIIVFKRKNVDLMNHKSGYYHPHWLQGGVL